MQKVKELLTDVDIQEYQDQLDLIQTNKEFIDHFNLHRELVMQHEELKEIFIAKKNVILAEVFLKHQQKLDEEQNKEENN
jgi:hypothetical protein